MSLWVRLIGALRRRSSSEPDAPTTWTQRVRGGTKAYQEGDFDTAGERFAAAFKRADVDGALNHRAAAALNNLALVYKRQNKLDQAEVALRRALKAYTVIQPDGPRTASVLNNLAGVYLAQRRYKEAVSTCKHAIALTEKIFGANHPKLAKRLESFARVLEVTNDPVRAAKLRARADAIRAARRKKRN